MLANKTIAFEGNKYIKTPLNCYGMFRYDWNVQKLTLDHWKILETTIPKN